MSKLGLAVTAVALAATYANAQTAPKYSAKVPPYITTPDTVETRIGTLKFFDGLPDPETVKKVYDNLDFARGVEAFLTGIPAASLYAVCEGLESGGCQTKWRHRDYGRPDGRAFAVPDGELYDDLRYACVWTLRMDRWSSEVPPGVLGPVDDAYFRCVTDVGLTGPDKGEGGKYLFVPPGYTGKLPSDGYFVVKSADV